MKYETKKHGQQDQQGQQNDQRNRNQPGQPFQQPRQPGQAPAGQPYKGGQQQQPLKKDNLNKKDKI